MTREARPAVSDAFRRDMMRRMASRLRREAEEQPESLYINPPVDLKASTLSTSEDTVWPFLWDSLLTWLTGAWKGTPDDSAQGHLGTVVRAQMLAALLRQALTLRNGATVNVKLQFAWLPTNRLLDMVEDGSDAVESREEATVSHTSDTGRCKRARDRLETVDDDSGRATPDGSGSLAVRWAEHPEPPREARASKRRKTVAVASITAADDTAPPDGSDAVVVEEERPASGASTARSRANTLESVDEEIDRETSVAVTKPTKTVQTLIHDILGWDAKTDALDFLRQAFTANVDTRDHSMGDGGESAAIAVVLSSSDEAMQRNYRIMRTETVAEGFANFRRCVAAIAWLKSFDAFVEDVRHDEALWERLSAWMAGHAPSSTGGGKRKTVAAKLYAMFQAEGVLVGNRDDIKRARMRFKRTVMGARRLKLVADEFGEAVFFFTEPQLEKRLLRYGNQAADRSAMADDEGDASVVEELSKMMREAAAQHEDMRRCSLALTDILHGRATIDTLPNLGWTWNTNTVQAARMQMQRAHMSSDGQFNSVGLVEAQ